MKLLCKLWLILSMFFFSALSSFSQCGNCTNSGAFSLETGFEIVKNSNQFYFVVEGCSLKIFEGSYPYQAYMPNNSTFNLCQRTNVPIDAVTDSLAITYTDLSCYETNALNNNTNLGIIGTVDIRDESGDGEDTGDDLYRWQITQNNSTNAGLYFTVSNAGSSNATLNVYTLNKGGSYNDVCTSNCPVSCLSYTDVDNVCDNPDYYCSDADPTFNSQIEYQTTLAQLSKQPMAFRPLSSHQGEISEVFLMDVMSQGGSLQNSYDYFEGIFKAFPKDIQYYILINAAGVSNRDSSIQALKSQIQDLSKQLDKPPFFVNTMDYCPMIEQACVLLNGENCDCDEATLNVGSQWAQDAFTVATGPGGFPILLHPLPFTDFTDYFAAMELSAATSYRTKHTLFPFDGGNILAGDSYLLVGADEMSNAMISLFGRVNKNLFDEIDTLFKIQFGVKEILWLGDTDFTHPYPSGTNYPNGNYQPIYHLDMFITPGGSIKENGTEKEILFVGDLKTLPNSELGDAENLVDRMSKDLDLIAKNLASQKLKGKPIKVIRIPLPLLAQTNGNQSSGSVFSLNNGVMEVRNNKSKTYFMPEYENDQGQNTRDQARKIFQKAGIKVVDVEGNFAQSSLTTQSSLHCRTLVLRRK